MTKRDLAKTAAILTCTVTTLAGAALADGPPGRTEKAFLQRYLQAQEAGRPDYSELTPQLAAVVRKQQGDLSNDMRAWGQLVSIKFNGGYGVDNFIVKFTHAEVSADVAKTDRNGKIASLKLTPGRNYPADVEPRDPNVGVESYEGGNPAPR